ncbi:hypothetical protein EJ04DRAFT_569079 [Polyplosphaeria fusca]|uniref:EthD domain-containing protein n=1 Tax=Polyplosphaeria fusca TaxID=682080 RepID=A0A9P4UXK6_9PLEO|nr:hypothetical protein EJ04DRAFT_569079 [Polyplosphaeria fusca]
MSQSPCPSHLTHPFTFSELSPGTGSNQQPYFRALVFFTKKPGLTDDFFHEHWKSVHADLAISIKGASVNLVRYVQFHHDARHKEMLAPLLGQGMALAPYDGCAEFHAKDAEGFLRFMVDVHAAKELVGCGSRFIDEVKGMHIMAGYDNLIFGGKIGTSGGSDGLLGGDRRFGNVK